MGKGAKFWTPEEDAYLIQHYKNITSREISNFLGRSIKSVQMRAFHIHEKASRSGSRIHWTNEMNNFLRQNYLTMTNKELAKSLGLKLTVCRNQLRSLNLSRDIGEWFYWSDDEVNFLKDNYKFMGDTELSEKLNELFRSNGKKSHRKTIQKKRRIMKLKRTKSDIQAINVRNLEQKRYNTENCHKAISELSDNYVLATLCNKNVGLREILKDNKDLIELQRTIMKSKRILKNGRYKQNKCS